MIRRRDQSVNRLNWRNPLFALPVVICLLYGLWSLAYFPFGFFRLSYLPESYPLLFVARSIQVSIFTLALLFYGQRNGWSMEDRWGFVRIGALGGFVAHFFGNLIMHYAYVVQSGKAIDAAFVKSQIPGMVGMSFLGAVILGVVSSIAVSFVCFEILRRLSPDDLAQPKDA